MVERASDAASAMGDQGPQRSRDTKCGTMPSLISALFISKTPFTISICMLSTSSKESSSSVLLQIDDNVRQTSMETVMRSVDAFGGFL